MSASSDQGRERKRADVWESKRCSFAFAPLAETAELTVNWNSVEVDVHGDLAIIVAWGEGELVTPRREASVRYRLTGVLQRVDGAWRWRLYHGSEPVAW